MCAAGSMVVTAVAGTEACRCRWRCVDLAWLHRGSLWGPSRLSAGERRGGDAWVVVFLFLGCHVGCSRHGHYHDLLDLPTTGVDGDMDCYCLVSTRGRRTFVDFPEGYKSCPFVFDAHCVNGSWHLDCPGGLDV